MIDFLKSIGIEKGSHFNPGAKTQDGSNGGARSSRAPGKQV